MKVARPHWLWWLSLLPPLVLLAVLSSSAGAFAAWAALWPLAWPQSVYRGIFAFAMMLHAGEAAYAYTLARGSDEAERALGWTAQTALLGYPSLRLLVQRVRTSPA
jgi:hypothetical protein